MRVANLPSISKTVGSPPPPIPPHTAHALPIYFLEEKQQNISSFHQTTNSHHHLISDVQHHSGEIRSSGTIRTVCLPQSLFALLAGNYLVRQK